MFAVSRGTPSPREIIEFAKSSTERGQSGLNKPFLALFVPPRVSCVKIYFSSKIMRLAAHWGRVENHRFL